MTKVIPLTQGQVATVDEDVYEHLMQWKWRAQWDNSACTYYAGRRASIDSLGKQTKVYMHRVIMAFYEGARPDMEVDHNDHDGLNNTKANLKWCTRRKNSENQRNNTSGYPGVSYDKHAKRYAAHAMIQGSQRHIGLFDTPDEAYTARVKFLKKYGE